MKTIWRQYEMLFVSIIAGIKVTGSVLGFGGISRERAQNAFAGHASEGHPAFGLFNNVILPQAGSILLLYLCYIVINVVVVSFIKKTLANKNRLKVFTNAALSVIAIILVAFILALGINGFTLLARPWYYNYGGFGLLAFFGYNEHPMANAFAGFDRAIVFAGIYLAYACIRELVIFYLESPATGKVYRVSIVNSIVTFFIVYLSLPVLLVTFNIVIGDPSESPFFIIYFGFVLPAFLVLFTNIYWLFPLQQKGNLLNAGFIVRLLISSFLCTFPVVFFFIFLHAGQVFVTSWVIQLFITTPISWLAWRQQKDKILQLRGMEKDLEKSKANLQFLRSQINPHFLFNALNTLYGMALQEGSENTAKGIQKLGDMMRFMLQENNQDFIPLHREIEYLQNYIQLQRLRTQASPAIVIEDNLGNQGCNHVIAPMLLIPLVENAFKHGISLAEKSWIKIELDCSEKNILFKACNSVHQRRENDPEKQSSGIGLKNVQERLKLIYPEKHDLLLSENSKEFLVQLSIQF